MTSLQNRTGNILSLNQGILVHSCDSEGGAHSPLMDSLRTRYPGACRVYKEAYESGKLTLGQVVYYAVPSPSDDVLIIASAIMQQGATVDQAAAETCFAAIAQKARETRQPVHLAPFARIEDGQPIEAGMPGWLGNDIPATAWHSA